MTTNMLVTTIGFGIVMILSVIGLINRICIGTWEKTKKSKVLFMTECVCYSAIIIMNVVAIIITLIGV